MTGKEVGVIILMLIGQLMSAIIGYILSSLKRQRVAQKELNRLRKDLHSGENPIIVQAKLDMCGKFIYRF